MSFHFINEEKDQSLSLKTPLKTIIYLIYKFFLSFRIKSNTIFIDLIFIFFLYCKYNLNYSHLLREIIFYPTYLLPHLSFQGKNLFPFCLTSVLSTFPYRYAILILSARALIFPGAIFSVFLSVFIHTLSLFFFCNPYRYAMKSLARERQ